MSAEYNPLLTPGFHDIPTDDLEQVFVAPFPDPTHRSYLVERLKVLLSIVNDVGIAFEIWIDGSFTTEKPQPSDIDIAFFFDPQEVNDLPKDKLDILMDVFSNPTQTKYRYKCDVYFVPNNAINDRSYWRGWFGFSRNEQPKGIARIILN
ncbi:MAG: hypothetical protein HZA22_06725 [Nitrospirae bacterium]|nr:hypothetical protein [Nitrospirota bacterium]